MSVTAYYEYVGLFGQYSVLSALSCGCNVKDKTSCCLTFQFLLLG
jgi:hypothetical protein